MQSYELPDATRRVPLLGAVGPLQFEIVQYRLHSEYGATSRIEGAPWTLTRWLDPSVGIEDTVLPYEVQPATDGQGRWVLLFPNEWHLRYFQERNPDAKVSDLPFVEL